MVYCWWLKSCTKTRGSWSHCLQPLFLHLSWKSKIFSHHQLFVPIFALKFPWNLLPAKWITLACSAALGTSQRRTLLTNFGSRRKQWRKQPKLSLVNGESNQWSQGGSSSTNGTEFIPKHLDRWYGDETIFAEHPNFEQNEEPIWRDRCCKTVM